MIGQKLKIAPPTGGHVFQRIGTTFELNQDIIKTNILTNFELGRDFIGTKLLTKFHEDRTRNVASRVFTSKCLQTDGRTDIRRTKTGHKSSPEQSGELKTINGAAEADAYPHAECLTLGRPSVEVQYQLEVNWCRKEEIIVKLQFWRGAPGLVMGPCIVEIDRIVIREVWYQFEDNQCRNEEIIFQGSMARTDRRTADITTISPRFSKSKGCGVVEKRSQRKLDCTATPYENVCGGRQTASNAVIQSYICKSNIQFH
ncbi:hypothetical protein DPMN_025710 [Dreissena polymorpha]|uniref:Uncharacterized protein n=1 Tax=Dreissena polymorpha TaxID=45954 RepID=A0A9D4LS37_DREPO|nr:hypothetical protein DPMN_025710 [Dreissena polymorpha]